MKDKYRAHIANGVTAFCVIGASILLFFLLFRAPSVVQTLRSFAQVLEPFLTGAVIAYLIAPFYNLTMGHLEPLLGKKLSPKHAHTLAKGMALFSSVLVVLVVVIGIFALVIPQFVNSFVVIINSLDTYSSNIMSWINRTLAHYPNAAQQVEKSFQAISDSFLEWVNEKMTPDAEAMLTSLGSIADVIANVVSGVKVIIRFAKDFFIGLFISAYLLASKRRLIAQAKKLTYSIFRVRIGNLILRKCRFIHMVFGGFIRGKLLDSLVMGILCFLGCSIFRFPYPIVVSVIVGITNIIPFFGPVVGAVPSAFLILLVSPIKCLYFILFVFALQQFDGNVLGPRILGDKTGLTSFWVLFSILVFGGLFGFVGMVIGVPVFAVIYSMVSTLVNHGLARSQLSQMTEEYELLDQVEEGTGKFLHGQDPEVKHQK